MNNIVKPFFAEMNGRVLFGLHGTLSHPIKVSIQIIIDLKNKQTNSRTFSLCHVVLYAIYTKN